MFYKINMFTMIELIIVMVIISLLSSIVVPNVNDTIDRAHKNRLSMDLKNIQTATDMFFLEENLYPSQKQPRTIYEDEEKYHLTEPLDFSQLENDYLKSIPSYEQDFYVDSLGKVVLEPFFKRSTKVITKGHHNFVFFDNGEVYGWGRNREGQLGLGSFDRQTYPIKIQWFGNQRIKDIALGWGHSLALLDNGEVYSWGYNRFGQLGLGVLDEDFNSPQKVDFFKGKKVKQLKAGFWHSLALLENNELYSWGYNTYGQLGHGTTINQEIPSLVNITLKGEVREIYAGYKHCMILMEDGTIYAWGYNEYGQLGLGHTNEVLEPQEVSFFKDKKVKDISIGAFHTAFLLQTGEVYVVGKNKSGQLGLGNYTDTSIPEKINLGNMKIRQIETGYRQTCLLSFDNKILVSGENQYGQLGLGYESESVNQFTEIPFFKEIDLKSIDFGWGHGIAIDRNDNVYSWGYNENGQLGLVHTVNKSEPSLVKLPTIE